MRYRDIEVVIQTAGEALVEFDVTINEEKKEVSCWVASEEGKVSPYTTA